MSGGLAGLGVLSCQLSGRSSGAGVRAGGGDASAPGARGPRAQALQAAL